MKTIMIERRKRHNHIIGGEFKEEYESSTQESMQPIFSDIFNNMDAEDYLAQVNEIKEIYDLMYGKYTIDDGDHIIFITID